MAFVLSPKHLEINHDTGGTDALAVRDSCGNSVEYATIVAYLKSDYDAGVYTELAVTETDSNGRWLTKMAFPASIGGEQLILRAYRAPGYRISSDDSKRRFLSGWGPSNIEVRLPPDCLQDNSGADITDNNGALICANLSPGTLPGQLEDESGNPLFDHSGAPLVSSPNFG